MWLGGLHWPVDCLPVKHMVCVGVPHVAGLALQVGISNARQHPGHHRCGCRQGEHKRLSGQCAEHGAGQLLAAAALHSWIHARASAERLARSRMAGMQLQLALHLLAVGQLYLVQFDLAKSSFAPILRIRAFSGPCAS